MHKGTTRSKRKEKGNTKEWIMAENFPKLNVRHQTIDPECSESSRQGKCQRNYA